MRRLLVTWVVAISAAGCGARAPSPLSAPHVSVETLTDKREAFARAYDLFRHDQDEQALPIFTMLAAYYPALADHALFFAGTIAVRRGDDKMAEEAFTRLLQEYPESVKAAAAALELGKLFLRAGRVDEVRARVQVALAAPERAITEGARLVLAEADERVGNTDAAYTRYMEVRRAMVGSPLGKTAKQRVVTLRAQRPDLIPAGLDLLSEARLLLAEHDYGAAQDAAERLLSRPDGVDPAAAVRVDADALYGRGAVEAGVARLQVLVDRYPSSDEAPSALFRLASIRWNRDQDAAALSAFAEFRRRYPSDGRAAEALYATGRIHQAAGRNEQAIQDYTVLLRRYPSGKLADEARWRIAWIRYLSRAWVAAARAFSRLASATLSSQQRNGGLYWQARALERSGQPEEARALYHEIIERDRADYYAMWAERRLGATSGPLILSTEQQPATAAGVHVAMDQAALGPEPNVEAFHFTRWEELKAAGVFAPAREELKAVERDRRDDAATMRYLLRAYQTVDGFAAAQRLLHRLGEEAGLSSVERQHLLYPLAFWDVVAQRARGSRVDAFLVESVMRQESLFDPQAHSPANAYGLLQLLPQTAARLAPDGRGIDPASLFEPDVNIGLGIRYLDELLNRFDGDVLKAIAAYNGGEAAVDKWERRLPGLEPDEFVESISFRETRDYVKRVMANYRAYRQLYAGDGERTYNRPAIGECGKS